MNDSTKWSRIHYMPCTPLYPGKYPVTGSAEHIALSKQVAADGAVLLKNEGGLLPLKKGTTLAVFGKAQADFVKGNGGSGAVLTAYSRSPLEALEIKQSQGKVRLFTPLSDFYQQYVENVYATGVIPGRVDEPELPAFLLKQARQFTDTALITLCRYSEETQDRTATLDDGDFYLSCTERAMVEAVLEQFSHVVVILNICAPMDVSWIKYDSRVSAALLPYQGGTEGGTVIADLLCGDAVPNGRLVDTFAYPYEAYPSAKDFQAHKEYLDYSEDIYVGYRYFETLPGAAETVCYPFGYGLSYGKFSHKLLSCELEEDRIMAQVQVENTGSYSGREVLQLYLQAPQGKLGKPNRVLIDFAKTDPLFPGQTQQLTLTARVSDFANYDDLGKVCPSAYVLEPGDYIFHLGTNVRCTETLGPIYHVDQAKIVRQLSRKCEPVQLAGRLLADGTEEKLPEGQAPGRCKTRIPEEPTLECPWPVPSDLWLPPDTPQLIDVYRGNMTLDAFIQALSLEQKVYLLNGHPNRGVANTFGMGNLLHFGVPNVMTADGPAGLRLFPQCQISPTAFPCATLIACTWDPSMAEKVGIAAAEEVRENGIGIWLAPGMNIHRDPLCGRNFEYYSEDPLITGIMASGMVKGIQSQGISAVIKHFACNSRETNRRECDSRISERALREIYLKGFEICVKQAKPWALMTAYNLLNGQRCSQRRDLVTDILRDEWGFDGLVMSDWANNARHELEIQAGNDIKMPTGTPERVVRLVKNGDVSEEDIDCSVKRLLTLILRLA